MQLVPASSGVKMWYFFAKMHEGWQLWIKAALYENWYFLLLGSPIVTECNSVLHHCREQKTRFELQRIDSSIRVFVGKVKDTEPAEAKDPCRLAK